MLEDKRKEYNKLFYKIIAMQMLKKGEIEIINGYIVELEKQIKRFEVKTSKNTDSEKQLHKLAIKNKKINDDFEKMREMSAFISDENIKLMRENRILKKENETLLNKMVDYMKKG